MDKAIKSAKRARRARWLGAVAWGVFASTSSSCFQLLPPSNPVDFCVEQARMFCELQFRCCTAAERRRDPFGVFAGAPITRAAPSSEGECLDVVAELCRAGVEQQNESLREERVAYDAEEAVGCLEEQRKAVDACDATELFDAQGTYIIQLLDNANPGILGSACDDAIEGVVEEGDDCFAPYECETGQCVPQGNTGNEVKLEGECQGTDRPVNPLGANIEFEICNGLGADADEVTE